MPWQERRCQESKMKDLQTWNDSISYQMLKRAANMVGIEKFGVTSASPFHTLVPFLESYYQEGRDTGFEHPMSELRWNPRAYFPEAMSIIAVAVPYQTKRSREMRHPPGRTGIVSRYAWGQDYHVVLKEQLEQLSMKIADLSKCAVKGVACVDTSPLVDRAIALRAGIGWIGKNGMLITKEYGSYVFLGALLTNVSIEPEPTSAAPIDDCGECTLCLQACPTGALLDQGRLDGKKCLSGITQFKGMIPEEYRPKLGRRIWGCDTCQTVCPKNQHTLVSMREAFEPDLELGFPDLKALLHISGRQFKRLYGHTAAAWRGHQVIRRNAIIALANAGDLSAVPDLLQLLSDPRPEIRGSAAWALHRLAPDTSRESVFSALQKESVEEAKKEMIWSLDC